MRMPRWLRWREGIDDTRESPAAAARKQLDGVEGDTLDVQQAVDRLWRMRDRLGPLIAEALREGRRP